jgi:asparagine synthase (glutamine-hydrolysing)
MKGIAGVVYPDVFQVKDMIQPMLATLRHRRQQDGNDVHIYKNIQIGVTGGKFAANEKRTILAAIDGFVVNGDELRRDLCNEGFHFKGKELSELIVNGYEKWDTAIFDHITGEFAIVILDQRKKRILLCRDRIGKKPLYWYHNQHYFIFGSELKTLMAIGVIPQSPALDSLSSYLYFGYIPQDMSPITGVNKLLPAHYLQFNFEGSKTIHTYWSYSSYFEKQNSSPLSTIVKDLDLLLRENISKSINKSEQVGVFLSGGLGSACIANYTSELVPKENVTAYTVGFNGENEEDMTSVKDVVKYLGIKHETSKVTSENFLKDLVKIVWYLDEPLADPHVISAWNLSSLASHHTKTVLSGMGSDELFAGHSRYSIAEQGSNNLRIGSQYLLNSIRKVLIPAFNLIYKPVAYQLVKQSRTNPWQFGYLEQNAVMDENEIQKASPRLGGIFDPEIFLHKFHHLSRVKSIVASYLYFDVKTRLPDEYLLQFERLTAAHSLNWRVPFLDRHIVEFVAQLPEPEFLKESETGSYLKAMMKNKLPESVIDRPKRTRKQFLRNWIHRGEITKIFSLLLEGTLVESGIISKVWLQSKISDLDEEVEAFMHLWSVLLLEIWFRLYINKPIQPFPPEVSVEQFLRENT